MTRGQNLQGEAHSVIPRALIYCCVESPHDDSVYNRHFRFWHVLEAIGDEGCFSMQKLLVT